MEIIGLTGGIASGKSTVASMLEQLGLPVLDADALYHSLIEPEKSGPSPLATQLEREFGPGILDPNHRLNRAKLGEIVFADPERRQALNSLTHPAVGQAFALKVQELKEEGHGLVVYDVPLLYEVGLDRGMNAVVCVWVDSSTQRERLRHRDGLAPDEIDQRLAAQMPLDEKKARADYIIDNSGSLEHTQAQVEALYQTLKQTQKQNEQ